MEDMDFSKLYHFIFWGRNSTSGTNLIGTYVIE